MKKRTLIITVLFTTIVGVGVVYAGAQAWKSGYGHKHGRHMGHDTERIVSKIDRRLDLTEDQETRIKEILDTDMDLVHIGRGIRQTLKSHLLDMDPLSTDYQQSVDEVADIMAQQVREKILASAEVVRKIAVVLDAEQMDKARKYLDSRIRKYEQWHNPDRKEH